MQKKDYSISLQGVSTVLEEVRTKRPLVHHITNCVTVNDCANITLAAGGVPVVAQDPDEVEEMLSISGALLLNIGTIDKKQVEIMTKAGIMANRAGIPVILDPVGAGATEMRTNAVERILAEVDVSVVKGNYAEICLLAGANPAELSISSEGELVGLDKIAVDYSLSTKALLVVTGKNDIVTNGETIIMVNNGHELMGAISGMGCMAGSLIACCLAVEEDPLKGAVAAMVSYGSAAEIAASQSHIRGPASFKIALFDSLYNLTTKQVMGLAKIGVS